MQYKFHSKKSTGLTIRATLFLLLIIWMMYELARPSIENILLKSYGQCAKAVITNEMIRVRYHPADFEYSFFMNGEYHKGNSLVTDADKIGDTICVVILPGHPSVNRPVIYFDDFKKCTCGK